MESWSELNERRRAVCARWPTIWRVPRIRRSTRFAAARIRSGERVLDVGASQGGFAEKLPEGVEYRTLDVDPRVEADYRTFDEVEAGSFDVVVSFETIEHLTLEQAVAALAGMWRALKPGGRLYLSTPNIHHPWSYRRSATHVTPFCYDELGGLLELKGFRLDGVYRCHHDAAVKALLRRLAYPLYRITGIDYAKSLLVEAHRPAE